MVRDTQQNLSKASDVLNASEIGQYHYCSLSWYLQRCGYEPKSPSLKNGVKKHAEFGDIIDYTKAYTKKSNVFSYIGYLLLITAVLIVLVEVIL
jgi:hypothetical protein